MKLKSAELQALLASLPWKVDADDARELDEGFNAFVQQASTRAAVPSLYVTRASQFRALVPASLQNGDVWVLWLPQIDPLEIEGLVEQAPVVMFGHSETRDVRLAWKTGLWCFMAYEEILMASLRDAYELGYVTVIVANASRVAVSAIQVDDEFIGDLLMGGSELQLDPENTDVDSEGRILIDLRPQTHRPMRSRE
jgi:hypothetical protein